MRGIERRGRREGDMKQRFREKGGEKVRDEIERKRGEGEIKTEKKQKGREKRGERDMR